MKKVALVSLGCAKNLVDSEYLLGFLRATGKVELVEDPENADIVIINTCAFIQPAKEESIEEILAAVEQKRDNPQKKIIAMGCLCQRYGSELKREIPEIDAIFGINNLEEIVEEIVGIKFEASRPYLLRHLLTPKHISYLKIAEGCSNYCSYCAIPLIRGPLRSRPLHDVVQEVKHLAQNGVKELYLVAQDTAAYLRDLGDKNGLLRLLKEIEKIDGIEWIRLMYLYPSHLTDELIDYVADSPKVLKYFDIPLQHINDKVLSLMGRRYNRAYVERLIEKIRKKMPNACLRSTFIVGFPAEGEEEFKELYNFLKDAEFDWAGFFKYYREEGTRAYSLGDLPQDVKDERLSSLEHLQTYISESKNRSLLKRKLKVIVDGKSQELPGFYEARSYRNAYEVDGIIYVEAKELKEGEFAEVTAVELANSFDLIAELEGGKIEKANGAGGL